MSQPTDNRGVSAFDDLEIRSVEILNSLPDGITVQDKNLNIIYQNDAMRAAFGNCCGKKCHEAYEKRDVQCEGCGLSKVFQSEKATLVIRTGVDLQGETAYWENACFPIRDEAGVIVAGAEVCRNITDRVSLEAEVRQRNLELGQLNNQLQKRTSELAETFRQLERETEQRERASIELRHAQKLQAVGQLAAGIAHEINTPLQFIGDNLRFLAHGFSDLLRTVAQYRAVVALPGATDDCKQLAEKFAKAESDIDLAYLEQNVPEAFTQTIDGVSCIATIVIAMKEFAHSDGKGKVAADINRALGVALTIARAEYRNVADVETELGAIPPVMCHPSELNQVFLNLIVNAAHAIADSKGSSEIKGRITVRTSKENENVRIDIGDTGCGISEEIASRIFEPFFTTKEVGCGTGQGLAIAHTIVVNKHGGWLTFVSKPGVGSTFTILLPIDGSPAAPADSASPTTMIRALKASLHDSETR